MNAAVCIVALCALCAVSASARASFTVAEHGRARCVIVTQPGASPSEKFAARELAHTLQQITGGTFQVSEAGTLPKGPAIIVGPGPLAAAAFPDIDLAKFEAEQLSMRTSGQRLLLAGGRPRGTLYAVYRFLYEQCGVRWWTPWATKTPHAADLTVPDLNVNEQPAFESRDPYWFPALQADWAARNGSNSQSAHLDAEHGGGIQYKGFVHTFYPLVPPEKFAAIHPEWYSLIGGKRTFSNAQLCTTNPQLRDFLVERVRESIKESPDARIISVSQNDCFNACECENCRAIDEREGSHAGTMIALVNYVAERIGKEFPDVAIDTLAYQYTRKAPRTIKPLPNVIVRLCSIECNFAAPLGDPSNKAFADDIRDWNRVCKRLYIWDYTTNFAHYVQPHPNWFVLGPNLRFFHDHGARGVFEQGAYQSFGSEMSEMRAWVLAQLLWNPDQDDRKLVREFLDGYYGKAAEPIWDYLLLLSGKAKGVNMGCYSPPSVAFLDFDTLSRAELLWEKAERAVRGDPNLLWRVKQGHLPVRYVFLTRWPQLQKACLATAAKWPLPASRKAVADAWFSDATSPGPTGWRPMTHLNEGGLTPQAFVARYAVDPPDPVALPRRGAAAMPPAGIPGANAACVDIQDDQASHYREGELSETRADPSASDGLAVWMPGSHTEWAVQFPMDKLPERVRTLGFRPPIGLFEGFHPIGA